MHARLSRCTADSAVLPHQLLSQLCFYNNCIDICCIRCVRYARSVSASFRESANYSLAGKAYSAITLERRFRYNSQKHERIWTRQYISGDCHEISHKIWGKSPLPKWTNVFDDKALFCRSSNAAFRPLILSGNRSFHASAHSIDDARGIMFSHCPSVCAVCRRFLVEKGDMNRCLCSYTGEQFRNLCVILQASKMTRKTVHTHRASDHQAAKLVAALLRVARVTAGLAESNGSLPPAL